jgi:sialidase-1
MPRIIIERNKKMRKLISHCILVLIGGTMLSSCNKRDTTVELSTHQIQVPVLKMKANNPVLQLNIIYTGEETSHLLTAAKINTEGTDDLKDIKSLRLLYFGKDSLWDEEVSALPFGADREPANSVEFVGEQELTPGNNFFWLSCELASDANIHHKVDASFEKVRFAGNTFAEPEITNPPAKQRIGVAVRKHMDDDAHTYRIPGLTTTNEGTLLAVYDARRESSRDLQGDMDIGVSRSTDGGNTWEPMRIGLDMGEWGGLPEKFNGVSDACILVDRNSDKIFLAGLWMHGVIDENGDWQEGLTEQSTAWNHQWRNKGSQPGFGVKETSQFLLTQSTDDGKSWTEPLNITTMGKEKEWWLWAPAPGRGITLGDGTLVFPSQGRDREGLPFSNITYSTDEGATWRTSSPAYHNTTECAVVQLSDGSLMLNMRDNRNRSRKGDNNGRAVATTDDMGKTWSEHPTSHSALKEPVCMASLHKHEYTVNGEKKSILLFSNPNVQERPRRRTTIKVSFDEGMTWPEEYWLLLDEGKNRGYSCLTSIDDHTIGILYEGSQADMTFESIPLEELLGR